MIVKKYPISLIIILTSTCLLAGLLILVTSIVNSPYRQIHQTLSTEVAKLISSKKADQIGVYFYDFTNGNEVGINDTHPFSPASLLKVAELMALYRTAEDASDILSKKFEATSVDKDDQNIMPEQMIQPHVIYTVDDLARYMIVYSDNEASNFLTDFINQSYLEQTFVNLVGKSSQTRDVQYTMSPKEYAVLLKALYDRTYLNDEYSDKALQLLTDVTYKNGLVAGVPQNVLVAHKFGERVFYGDTHKQLHDCGVIYYPNNPYLLCIMTQGKDMNVQAQAIKDISQAVYKNIAQ